jgi:hypothetical protein
MTKPLVIASAALLVAGLGTPTPPVAAWADPGCGGPPGNDAT